MCNENISARSKKRFKIRISCFVCNIREHVLKRIDIFMLPNINVCVNKYVDKASDEDTFPKEFLSKVLLSD